MQADTYGILIIGIFVARHDNLHRGGLRRLATIRCQFGEAEAIFKAWLANNSTFKTGYNSPLGAEFRAESVPIS